MVQKARRANTWREKLHYFSGPARREITLQHTVDALAFAYVFCVCLPYIDKNDVASQQHLAFHHTQNRCDAMCVFPTTHITH